MACFRNIGRRHNFLLSHFRLFKEDLHQRTSTSATKMSSWHNRATLPMIRHTTSNAFPGIAIQRINRLIQLMTNGNAQPCLIHSIHHFSKRWAMRGTTFPNIKLPLMNHLMGQGSLKLCLRLSTKERRRKPDHSGLTMPIGRRHPATSWAHLAHKQPRRCG